MTPDPNEKNPFKLMADSLKPFLGLTSPPPTATIAEETYEVQHVPGIDASRTFPVDGPLRIEAAEFPAGRNITAFNYRVGKLVGSSMSYGAWSTNAAQINEQLRVLTDADRANTAELQVDALPLLDTSAGYAFVTLRPEHAAPLPVTSYPAPTGLKVVRHPNGNPNDFQFQWNAGPSGVTHYRPGVNGTVAAERTALFRDHFGLSFGVSRVFSVSQGNPTTGIWSPEASITFIATAP